MSYKVYDRIIIAFSLLFILQTQLLVIYSNEIAKVDGTICISIAVIISIITAYLLIHHRKNSLIIGKVVVAIYFLIFILSCIYKDFNSILSDYLPSSFISDLTQILFFLFLTLLPVIFFKNKFINNDIKCNDDNADSTIEISKFARFYKIFYFVIFVIIVILPVLVFAGTLFFHNKQFYLLLPVYSISLILYLRFFVLSIFTERFKSFTVVLPIVLFWMSITSFIAMFFASGFGNIFYIMLSVYYLLISIFFLLLSLPYILKKLK